MKKKGNKKMPTPRHKLIHNPIPTSLFLSSPQCISCSQFNVKMFFLCLIIHNKPLVPTIPSHIKDSPHLISLIPSNAILATIDVSTNIPKVEGTEACLDAIYATEASHIPRDVLRQLFEIVRKCNVYELGYGNGDKDGTEM